MALYNPFSVATGDRDASSLAYDGVRFWGQNYEKYEPLSFYWKMTLTNPTTANWIRFLVNVADDSSFSVLPNMDGLPVTTEFNPQQLDDAPRTRVVDVPPQSKRTIRVKINYKQWARKNRTNLENTLGTCGSDPANWNGWTAPAYHIMLTNVIWVPDMSNLQASFTCGITKELYAKIRFSRRRTPWIKEQPAEPEGVQNEFDV